MRVIVTRPAAQAGPWVERLRAQGIDAVALPLIQIVPPDDEAPVREAWKSLDRFGLVFFASANAVHHFFAQRPPSTAWPDGALAAAPGPGTAAALRLAGLPDRQRVEPAPDAQAFDSEALWAQLSARRWAGARVLVVRGQDGRDWLADQLRAAGAELHFVAAYARRAPVLSPPAQALLESAAAAPSAYLWLLSSSEAVRHLAAMAPQVAASGRALATHPRIAEAARAVGFAEVRACGPGEATVIQALRDASIQSAAT